jgi:uncharacterized protein YegP (UPF0339 family)
VLVKKRPIALLKLMKFEVYKDASGEWRWRLQSANEKTVAVSGEGYVRRETALAGIELVKGSAGAAVEGVG